MASLAKTQTRKERIMKKLLLAMICVLFLALPALAGEQWTIQPRYPDIYPNDGIGDAGSYTNPYELQDSYGRTRGIMRSRYPDIKPNDGIGDAGSYANPYEIDWN